jgi:hypothetical protein
MIELNASQDKCGRTGRIRIYFLPRLGPPRLNPSPNLAGFLQALFCLAKGLCVISHNIVNRVLSRSILLRYFRAERSFDASGLTPDVTALAMTRR